MKTIQIPRRYVRHSWGGVETVVAETSKRLSAWGHEVRVVCPNALAETDHEIIEGVEVQRLPYFYPYIGLNEHARRQLDYRGGNMFSPALYRVLRRERCLDLIHLHTGKRIGGIARRVALSRGIPYVITLHGGVFDVPAETEAGWIEPTASALEWGKVLGWWVGSRRVLQDADAIITLGDEERRRVQTHLPDQRVEQLPNGVEPGRFREGNGSSFRHKHGIPALAPVILCVARLDRQKNQLAAVRTLEGVRRSNIDAHLVLVGPVTDPEYAQTVEREIEERGLAGHTTLIPGLDADSQELVDAYHSADVVLLSSRHEPFGIVILEAWAAGVPVVATSVGGVRYLVRHGKDGLVVPPGADEELVQQVCAVLGNPEMGQRLGKEGKRRVVAEFSWDRVTSHLVGLYEDVVRRSANRREKVA